MRHRPWLLLTSAGMVGAFALLPVAYLIWRTIGAGSEAWELLRRPSVLRVFGNSALLMAATTALSVVIGVPLAWLTVRSDLPFRRFWSVAAILPLAIPSYIMAYAFIALLGPHGTLAKAMEPLGVKELPDLYGFPGTALVIALINYPFVVLSVRAALHRMDPALEEAAMGLGRTRREIFLRVILPQLRPAMVAGGLLVALYTLSDFGAPALMQFKTFTQVIYVQYSVDRTSAAVTALALVALTVVILFAETLSQGRGRFYRSVPAAQKPPKIVHLGRWRWPAVGFCAAMLLVSVGLPIFALVWWLAVGLAHHQPLAIQPALIVNSVLAAFLAAAVAVAAGLPVVVLAVRRKGRLAALIDRSTYAGNALPGIVIALSLVFFGSKIPWLYQTLPLLIFAYVARFLPQSVGAMKTGLLQLNPRIEEAARGLGHPPAFVFFTVTLPLLLPGILAGGALVFLTTIKELPITLLLHPTGFDTLVGEIWWTSSQGLFSQASPPALLLVGVSALSIAVILRQERRGENA